jgi:hypothetical protein
MGVLSQEIRSGKQVVRSYFKTLRKTIMKQAI